MKVWAIIKSSKAQLKTLAFVKEDEHFYYYNLQFLSDLNAHKMNSDLLYQVAGQLNESACIFKRTTGLSLRQYAGWLVQLKPRILRNLPAGPKILEQSLIELRSYSRQLGTSSRSGR
jgi:hypothetical protein